MREKSKDLAVVAGTLEKRKGQSVPEWLQLDSQARSGRVLQAPSREAIPVPVTEQLIVELYSK
jgi:small subunit ribosomal protein S4